MFKLTKKQTEELVKHGYTPAPKGAFLDLYWNDFPRHEWENVCDCLGIDHDAEKVIIAYVGVQEREIE
tara:strand:+ start:1563 stop:1766 length:204 start_codon:yes stop_codon:yes gene_type:complete